MNRYVFQIIIGVILLSKSLISRNGLVITVTFIFTFLLVILIVTNEKVCLKWDDAAKFDFNFCGMFLAPPVNPITDLHSFIVFYK